MTNYAVILCGGYGGRFGGDKPKQFADLAGKPILHHTIRAFQACQGIDEIIVVCKPDYMALAETISGEFDKVSKVVRGGAVTRSQSAYNGVNAIAGKAGDNVLIHDGVRPFVTAEIIENCLLALRENSCVSVAIQATDTLYEIDGDMVTNIPKREDFVMVQTPQGFEYQTIKSAYDLFDDNLSFSDDCGLVKHYLPDVTIAVVAGDKNNIKITTPFDMQLAQQLFKVS